MLPQDAADRLRALEPWQADGVSELRLYSGRQAEATIDGEPVSLALSLDQKAMDEVVAALSGYALYSVERQMGEGYIPLPGGHRAGVCGQMERQKDGGFRMIRTTSVCIRIARRVPGAQERVRVHLLEGRRPRSVLLLGPPGCGKTTLLRESALFLSDCAGLHVCAADEREELFPQIPPGCGKRLDVLSGMDKASACMLLLRSMAPQVIVTDEVGRDADVSALEEAACCGAAVLASAHAEGDGRCRPAVRRLMDMGVFERYVLLGGRGMPLRVWSGQEVQGDRESRGERDERNDGMGYGRHGDDRDQCDRVSDFIRGGGAGAVDPRDAPLPAAHERHHTL